MAERRAEDSGYPYQRLDNGSQIRVLDLQPGFCKNDIHGRLRTVSRNDTNYEALSYVWGPRTQGRTLYLDEQHKVSITDNLFLALRRLRNRWKIRTLWTDAVCINQLDDIEKSEQVAAMADIYRGANIVNVWLGESKSARSIHLKCAFLPRISPGFAFTTHMIYHFRHCGQALNNLASDVTWICQNLGEPSQMQDVVDVVEPWYSRAWTLQEFFLAQRIRFCLGGAEVKWVPNALFLFTDIKYRRQETLALRLSLPKKDLDSIRARITACLPGWANRASFTLLDSIRVLSSTSATDPRDMVYSILGILKKEIQQFIHPDYTLTHAEVCATATAAALRASTTEILSHVKLDRDEDASWPSWAVDFAEQHRWLSYELHQCFAGQICIASFQSTTLGILGRTLGTAIQSKAILASDVTTVFQPYIRASYERRYDPLTTAEAFIQYADEACGSTCLIKLSNGVEVLGPGVVQPGDQLIRLCYTEPFRLPYPEIFVWLRPNGDTFLFRGLGLVLGDTVYTTDYDDIYRAEPADNRTDAEKRAGFETFLVR